MVGCLKWTLVLFLLDDCEDIFKVMEEDRPFVPCYSLQDKFGGLYALQLYENWRTMVSKEKSGWIF